MSASSTSWDTRKTELELPEEIDLQVELANVGSRTLGILIDIALGGLVLFVIYALIMLFARNLADEFMTWRRFKLAAFFVFFGFQWIYFNFFEWLWNGQTPGKRLLQLRVIKVDGSPVGFVDVLLRNLSRPIDTLGPMGLLGLLMIFVSRKAQRLGDLMARTLVIHETKIDWSIFDQLEQAADGSARPAAPSVRLTSSQWELLHRYLNRREKLQPDARARLAQSLFDTLKPAVHGTELALSALPPEEWLVELAKRS